MSVQNNATLRKKLCTWTVIRSVSNSWFQARLRTPNKEFENENGCCKFLPNILVTLFSFTSLHQLRLICIYAVCDKKYIPYILESNPHSNLIRTFPSTAPCLQDRLIQ